MKINIELLINMEQHLLDRWAKDYNVYIAYYEKNYLRYILERIYEYRPHKVIALQLMYEELQKYESDSERLLNTYREVRDTVIYTIKKSKHYKAYNEMDLNHYSVQTHYGAGKVYNASNHEKILVSIDLVAANYQVLQQIGVIKCTGDWKTFMSEYTDSNYLKGSKYIRQVILGNCNPRRQVTLEKYYMNKVLHYLLNNMQIEKNIKAFYNDEIIYETTNVDINFYKKLEADIQNELGLKVDIELFKLEYVKDDFSIKHFINKEGYELKGVPGKKFLQGLAYAENRPLNELDRIFWDDGCLAQYLQGTYENIQRKRI